MRLEYDPVAEDFLLIDQGRVIAREYIPATGNAMKTFESAYNLLMRLKRPARSTDPVRKPIDAKIQIDESMIKRYDSKGRPILEDLDLDLEDLL